MEGESEEKKRGQRKREGGGDGGKEERRLEGEENRETALEEPGAKGALCERYKVHSSSLVTEVRFVVH